MFISFREDRLVSVFLTYKTKSTEREEGFTVTELTVFTY